MNKGNNKNAKKKVTLESLSDTVESLAKNMANNFKQAKKDNEDLAKRMNESFTGVDAAMDQGFAKANARMDEWFLRAKRDNDDLTTRMDEGFAKAHERMDQGFAKANARMDKGFVQAKKDNDDLAVMVANQFDEMKKDMSGKFNEMDTCLDTLEHGQEQIQMRLINVAYSVDIISLQKRVRKLEDTVLTRRRK